jgi:hypothetical protein
MQTERNQQAENKSQVGCQLKAYHLTSNRSHRTKARRQEALQWIKSLWLENILERFQLCSILYF